MVLIKYATDPTAKYKIPIDMLSIHLLCTEFLALWQTVVVIITASRNFIYILSYGLGFGEIKSTIWAGN